MTDLLFQKVQFVTIDPDLEGQRIDNYLRTFLKGVPKSLIYRILRKGEVRVNKKRVKPEYKLQANDELRNWSLYTSDAADDLHRVDPGCRRCIKQNIYLHS